MGDPIARGKDVLHRVIDVRVNVLGTLDAEKILYRKHLASLGKVKVPSDSAPKSEAAESRQRKR